MQYRQLAAFMRAHGVGAQRVRGKVWRRKSLRCWGANYLGAKYGTQSVEAQSVGRKIPGGAKCGGAK